MKLQQGVISQSYEEKTIIMDSVNSGNIYLLEGISHRLWDLLVNRNIDIDTVIQQLSQDYPNVEREVIIDDIGEFISSLENKKIIANTNLMIDNPQKAFKYLVPFFEEICDERYALIKGPALSKMLYGDVEARTYSDIDILVPRDALKRMEHILRKHGFVAKKLTRRDEILSKAFSHQSPPWVKRCSEGNIVIDINYDIFWGEYSGKKTDINDFLDDTKEEKIYNSTIKVLTPEKALVQLVLHHYKELNSIYHLFFHNGFNEGMIDEIYMLINKCRLFLSDEDLYNICKKYDILPYAYYIFYFTNDVFSGKIQSLVDLVKSPQGEILLNKYGLSEDERKEWNIAFQSRRNVASVRPYILQQLTEKDKDKLNRQIILYSMNGDSLEEILHRDGSSLITY